MAEKVDYYEVLGVDRKADLDEIKKAFRQAALKHHPDRNPGDKAAEARFKEAAEAYGVLCDPQKRAQYDQFGHRAFGPGGSYEGPTFTSMEDILAHFGDVFGAGMFGDVFGGRGRSGPRPGRDLKIVLDLSLEEIEAGVERTVALKRLEHCTVCGGSGAKPGTSPIACPTCGGRGQIHRNQGFFTMATTCVRCRGLGQVIESPCSGCKGAGRLQEKSEIKITIPPGIEEGVRLRVPGQGDAGDPGAPRGDLYCVVREVEHRIFRRSGADLMCELPVSFPQLTLGEKVEIPTLRGRAAMTIPAGTENGKVLRLRGQGLPHLEGRGKGDLLVRVFIEVPTSLTDRQKEILREFAEIDARRDGNRSFFEKIAGYFS